MKMYSNIQHKVQSCIHEINSMGMANTTNYFPQMWEEQLLCAL